MTTALKGNNWKVHVLLLHHLVYNSGIAACQEDSSYKIFFVIWPVTIPVRSRKFYLVIYWCCIVVSMSRYVNNLLENLQSPVSSYRAINIWIFSVIVDRVRLLEGQNPVYQKLLAFLANLSTICFFLMFMLVNPIESNTILQFRLNSHGILLVCYYWFVACPRLIMLVGNLYRYEHSCL